jgi:hypothetical protein
MAAITGIVFVKRVPVGGAVAGALVKEIWKIPASTAGDTQTLALPHIKTVLSITGNASATVQAVAGDGLLPVTTLATVAASNFTYLEIIGTE